MRRAPAQPDLPKVMKMIADATAAGTHSAGFLTVCDGCRQWVQAIHYFTLDGKRLCYECTPTGQKAKERT